MSQCKHWRILIFLFPVLARGKRNASESCTLRHQRNLFCLPGQERFLVVIPGDLWYDHFNKSGSGEGKRMISLQTDSLMNGFAERSKEILRDNLVGVYLHGSLVMGCFNPQKSDIDLIIVAAHPLSDADKRKFMDMVVECNAMGPAKGIEMSVVLRAVCKPFVYPTPYELHFSAGHLNWYKDDPDDYIRRMNGTDKDLAAHFTIINKRGRRLYGAQIEDVFAEVPSGDYMDSLWYDVEGAAEEITKYPMYLTLNLARVLAYREDRLVLSKKEGGEWAIKALPSEYRPLITDAMREYSESAEVIYDKALAKQYAEYVIKRIQQ